MAENLQLDSDFTGEQYRAGEDTFVNITAPPGSAITSLNGLSGPSVTLSGGSTGYSFSTAGTTLTLTGAAASIKESSGPTVLSLGAIPDNTFLKRSGTDVVGVSSIPAPALSVVTKTSNYTLTDSDDVILVDCSGGPVTVNLHAVATAKKKNYCFKKIDSSANAMILDGASSEQIDGAATLSATVQYTAYTLVPDGAAWHII